MKDIGEANITQDARPNVAAKPHFVLGPDKVRALRERVIALKLGDLRKDVTASLGPADREELIGPKKGRDWKCRRLLYYIIMVDEAPGNTNDVKVELVFERQGDRLVAVISNADGIPNRGDMTTCR